MRPELAGELKTFLALKATGALVFNIPTDRKEAAKMFQADLVAAGIPYVVSGPDGPLFADFHCLRHTFITNLAAGGVLGEVPLGSPARHLDDRAVLEADEPALDRRRVDGQHPVGRELGQVATGWALRDERRSSSTAAQIEPS